MCSINITSPAVFDFGYPLIIVVNIKPLSKRGDEGYDPNPVRLRDVKRILQVGPFEYKLRAVIHHTFNPAHFTATLIVNDNTLYFYDDLKGVKETGWFRPKSPAEYERRRERARQMDIVLDELFLQSVPNPINELIM